MTTYESKLVIGDLLNEAENLSYWLDGAGVYMSITQSGGLAIPLNSKFWDAIKEIADIRKKQPLHVMINNLPSNVIVPRHTDAVRKTQTEHLERWHLPLKTNDKCWWWDEKMGNVQMILGTWYGPCPYWIEHQVINLGETNRIHFIVDLE